MYFVVTLPIASKTETKSKTEWSQVASSLSIERTPGGGGELPYEEHMGVCHELGSHFQEKIPKRACQFLTKIPERAIISVRISR